MKPFRKLRRNKKFQFLKSKVLYQKHYIQYQKRKLIRKEKYNSIYIFNHVPKCGGTSLKRILTTWFYLIPDYPPHDLKYPNPKEHQMALNKFIEEKPDYKRLKPWEIIAGHYHKPEFGVAERFPGIFEDNRVKLITFLREPLEHRISHYYFGVRKGHHYLKGVSMEEYVLKGEKNFMAGCLGCTLDNYKEVLNKYFFIGLVEEFDRSVIALGKILGRKSPRNIPHTNSTKKMVTQKELSKRFVTEFKENNLLDYLVYDYATELFNTRLVKFYI